MTSEVALITGASRGIGAAIALRLARSGRSVAINSYPSKQRVDEARTVADRIAEMGRPTTVLPADVGVPTQVNQMFNDCEERLGVVRTLVLNAAIPARGPWDEFSDFEWDRVIAVNLLGAVYCARRASSRWGDDTRGVIVTVSSILAELGSVGALPYTTTKAALVGFTRSLARELGPAGSRVNCVTPGAIRTEEENESVLDQRRADEDALFRQALKRRGVADDIAAAVNFLTSSDSSFITGQTICVDGGWHLK
ncbi:SDR family NAD(P)-dependent oxidoreductase [Amycolatopsis thermoflava]|uniref:SDR family NAD(P)-dependent oxidoreductase n=1 Tax=Amycolatopsis thermoflava TaxID=84480 RepID=UPI003EC12C84